MSSLYDTVNDLRRMTEAELAQVAEDGLGARLKEQAAEAKARHGRLGPGTINAYLQDRATVRRPTRLVLEYGDMGLHQFAQPHPDPRAPGGVALFLRPALGKRPDYVALAVSYMIPVINYGDVVQDRHCVAYGAAITDLSPDGYFENICRLADFVGADELRIDDASAPARGCSPACACR